jgi:hypothetical protein
MAIMTARGVVATLALVVLSHAAMAAEPIGQIKTQSGAVHVQRAGAVTPLAIGDRVYEADTIITTSGTVGITFADNSMMSLGPNSRLSLDQFKFDATTHNGIFSSSLTKGTLSVRSGQIVRQTPEAMRIRTPAALLGVRGTEFVVRADGSSS